MDFQKISGLHRFVFRKTRRIDWGKGNKPGGGEISYYRILARRGSCSSPGERWPCPEFTQPHLVQSSFCGELCLSKCALS